MLDDTPDSNPVNQRDALEVLLWIWALKIANGFTVESFRFGLDTWPDSYRPDARA